jgi:hypothetical protein
VCVAVLRLLKVRSLRPCSKKIALFYVALVDVVLVELAIAEDVLAHVALAEVTLTAVALAQVTFEEFAPTEDALAED